MPLRAALLGPTNASPRRSRDCTALPSGEIRQRLSWRRTLGRSLDPQGHLPTSRGPARPGRAEARLIATGTAPLRQRAAGSMDASAPGRLVEVGLEVVDAVCDENGCDASSKRDPAVAERAVLHIQPEADAEFVCATEDALEAYHRPFGERMSLICPGRGEQATRSAKRLQPLPAEPGQAERFDATSHVRNGHDQPVL